MPPWYIVCQLANVVLYMGGALGLGAAVLGVSNIVGGSDLGASDLGASDLGASDLGAGLIGSGSFCASARRGHPLVVTPTTGCDAEAPIAFFKSTHNAHTHTHTHFPQDSVMRMTESCAVGSFKKTNHASLCGHC